jgi:undecaprenyl-diphosphatase
MPPRRIFRPLSLIGTALFLFCLWSFWEIAEDYPEEKFRAFDEAFLRGLRSPVDLSVPRGPTWAKDMMRDISALGSGVVLTLGVLGVVIYLVLEQRRRSAVAVALTCLGGVGLDLLLKSIAERPRPTIVPHLTDVTTTSFPSGHTLLSAIIYLSVGTTVALRARSRSIAAFAIGFPALLTILVGFSRVYLGVHYPTDVLASWSAGLAWTLLCVAGQKAWDRFSGGECRDKDRP